MKYYSVAIQHKFLFTLSRSKLSSAAAGFDAVREQILIGNPTGERPNAPDLVIMITDSNPDTDVSKTLAAAQQLKGMNYLSLPLIN